MRAFEEIERFEIRDRGTAISVRNPHDPTFWDPDVLSGETVMIGAQPYKVLGVERYRTATPNTEARPYRAHFALLVESAQPE